MLHLNTSLSRSGVRATFLLAGIGYLQLLMIGPRFHQRETPTGISGQEPIGVDLVIAAIPPLR
jgi:hypothetical protein